MKSSHRCFITVNSPLHIGCDEVYEPAGFVLDEIKNCLVHFDPVEFIAGLPETEKKSLSEICRQGNLPSILRLYKFFQGKSARGRKVAVTPEFVEHYRSTLRISENRIQQELNRFVIERTAFRAFDNRPYIPGSSLKGALRTGYLNHICGGRRADTRDGKELENKLLNYRQIDEDPFARVKVSDFQPVGEINTRIVYAVNKKKKPSEKEARGPYQILEIIEPGSIFTGEITVLPPLPGTKIKTPVKLEELISGTHRFYIREHQRENRELASAQLSENFFEKSGKTLVRMGRHSGAESVTIAGNRSIKIMKGPRKRPDFLDHATTFWLAAPDRKPKSSSGVSPFGWVAMMPLDQVSEKQLDEQENAYLGRKRAREKEKQALLEQQARKEAEAQKKEAAERARIEQEKAIAAQRQKELETMSPEDRELAEIFNSGEVIENEVVALYNRLDEMADSLKIKCAEKIRDYYKSEGKWNVSKKKKKQFEKVRNLKSILGET